MALNAREKENVNSGNKKAADPIEPGSYPARLVQIIDLGVQEQNAFKGEPKPPAQMLKVTYELVDEFMKDEDGNDLEDKPRWISEDFPLYNLDVELAKSTKRYYALDPNCDADGDWAALVSNAVLVNIIKEAGKGKNAGKVFNNIQGTTTMRKKEADKLPALKNPAKIFDQGDVSTVDIFFTLPDWIQDRIKKGLEWEGSVMAKAVANYKGEKNAKQDKKAIDKKTEEDNDAGEDIDAASNTDDGSDW